MLKLNHKIQSKQGCDCNALNNMKQLNNIITGALTLLCGASMIQSFSATSPGQQVFLIGTMCISAILAITILKTSEQ